MASIAAVQPLHVAAWLELQMRERAAPSVKQQLATIRHLFDWLVTDQVIPTNPAASVRGSSHIVQRGQDAGPRTGRGAGSAPRTPLPQANAYAMIGPWALAASIDTKLDNHSFRATGITAYLKNGGTLEKATAMASHASTRTTQLYDRRHDEMRSNGSGFRPPAFSKVLMDTPSEPASTGRRSQAE